jgi:hypothetical protein
MAVSSPDGTREVEPGLFAVSCGGLSATFTVERD